MTPRRQAERLAILVLETRDADAATRPETWPLAVRTVLAREETCLKDVPNPAEPRNVHEAELDELRCRNRHSDAAFLARAARLAALTADLSNYDSGAESRDGAVGRLITVFEADILANGDLLEDRNPQAREGDRLTGLALSGGGIRSATFNLGVLQGLARHGILKQFDYLSGVSGGGYIGGWLAAWMKREDPAAVCDGLDPEKIAGAQARPPISFLRKYSNYLTPQLGLLSGDTWAVVSIYLRNTMLNLIILISFLSFLLLLPRVFLCVQTNLGPLFSSGHGWAYNSFYVLLLVPLGLILVNLTGFTCKPINEGDTEVKKIPIYGRPAVVAWAIVLPVVLAAVLAGGHVTFVQSDLLCAANQVGTIDWITVSRIALALLSLAFLGLFYFPVRHWFGDPSQVWKYRLRTIGTCLAPSLLLAFWLRPYFVDVLKGQPFWVLIAAGIGTPLWIMAWLGGVPNCFLRLKRVEGGFAYVAVYLWGAVLLAIMSAAAGLAGVTFLLVMAKVFIQSTASPWVLTVWSVPMMIADVSLIAYLFIGMMGRNFPDERREWISRLAGILLLVSLSWAGICGAAFYSPVAMQWLGSKIGDVPAKTILATVWSVITWAAVKAAGSKNTGGSATEATSVPTPLAEALAKVGPYVFVAGLVTLLSVALGSLLQALYPKVKPQFLLMQQNWEIVWPAALFLIIAVLFSMTVDVNEFSMHHFYRNRIVRAYLGASNRFRSPNGFTGFDSRDDIALARLTPSQTTPGMAPYLGPYPIFNAALNLTTGKNLAYQERQATSFTFTPRFCGAECGNSGGSAYRPTLEYAYPNPGIHIGTAMAISGAAVSPNRGYHSSPATAFLLTVFNVRLGWWLGNPAKAWHWKKASPWQGLAYLLKELAGASNDRSGYVYLSDGGHFDNLGIYELVKRKCRFIVACDAEEDRGFGFEGLGNAIRKCRADLGVGIEIDVEQIRPKSGEKRSRWHCVVGKIHYEEAHPDAEPGVLLYLKSSLTGDEDGDLLEYSLRRPEFPHQTTADQFFDESQFESYRQLGYHICDTTFKLALEDVRKQTSPAVGAAVKPEDLFHMLAVRWYPPSPANKKSFTRHTEHLDSLQERLRSDRNLRFLYRQFYPEWKELQKLATARGVRESLEAADEWFAGVGKKPPHILWIPRRAEQIRAGFFFCQLLIQLMENVYLDLNLERYSDHPDNQGWMNLFRHWSYSGMFQVAWAIGASTYGSRFSLFCQRELDISTGKTLIVNSGGFAVNTARAMPEAAVGHTVFERQRIADIKKTWGAAKEYQLRLEVSPDADAADKPFQFAFGTMLIDKGQIVYLRVRRHLRRIGLARRALREAFGVPGLIDPIRPLIAAKPLATVVDEDWEQLKRLVESTRP
jgi:predicted acylesterase/phospholipase RssA